MSLRETSQNFGQLALRVAFGGLMLVHGVQKVMGYKDLVEVFPDPIGLGGQFSLIAAIGAEVGCSILLIFGLATRLAAVPLAFTMCVALFVVHANDPWQGKELAATYLAAYVSLFFTGPGAFSLDRLIFKPKPENAA